MTSPVDLLDLTRSDLEKRRSRVLRAGAGTKPDLWLAQEGSASVVVKDFAGRGRFVRELLGPWLVTRELRAYERLLDHPSVPKLVGRVDAMAFVVEYRPGELVSDVLRRGEPQGFLDALGQAVDGLHQRGVAHLDLRHRSNVLVGKDGRPVVIDFASAVCFRPAGLLGRTLGALLCLVDRRALTKWRDRGRGGRDRGRGGRDRGRQRAPGRGGGR